MNTIHPRPGRCARPIASACAAAGLVAALVACSARPRAPVGSRIGLALIAALSAADATRAPWRCAAPDGPSVAQEVLTVGPRTWRLGAHAMGLDGAGATVIGVIADAAGSAPATLAALGRLRQEFADVDLVLSLGGMGATRAELEATFAALAERAPWPLVALPGDLEPVPAQADAIAALRRRGASVIDGRLVHRIELPGATIAIVPGAIAASRLVAGTEGCSYRRSDAAAAFADLTQRPGLRILASAEPPRDGFAPEPSGELAVTVSAGQQIDIALHGPTSGAATRARSGGRTGSAISLTPGSSDATPRLPEPRTTPSAGVLTVHGNAWSWRPIEDVR